MQTDLPGNDLGTGTQYRSLAATPQILDRKDTRIGSEDPGGWTVAGARVALKTKMKIFAILGWVTAVVTTAGSFVLFQSLQGVLAREQRLRQSTAGLENRTAHSADSDVPLVLITGDSRAADLGESSLGSFAVVNRGVPGQTAIEVLARFGRDLAVTRPDRAIVIAGVNDLKHGVRSLEELTDIVRSFEEILMIGEAMGIPVMLCPVWGASSKPTLRGLMLAPELKAHVEDMNRLLDTVAKENGADFARVSELLDEQGLVRESLSSDALHLNAAGLQLLRKSLLESLDSNDGAESD